MSLDYRANKSPIWVYFDIVESDEKFVKCRLCGGKFSRGGVGKAASTTPLLNHVKKMHTYAYEQLYLNPGANMGSITTGCGPPIVNLPHNHIPDMHALARARCRSIQVEAESSSTPSRSVSPSSGPSIGPADVIPLLHNPQDILQVEHSDTEPELEEPPQSLLKPSTSTNRSPAKSSTSSTPLSKSPPSPESEMCLRWNSHHANMSTVIPALMDDERYVDVSLMAEGKIIRCHKLILSSCSCYFDEMLKNTNSNQQTVIFLRDIQFWQIKALVDFMYKGEVNVDQSKLESLLKAAEDLQIKGLAGKSPKKEQETIVPPADLPPTPEIVEPEIKTETEQFTDNMLIEEDGDEEYFPHAEFKRGKYKKNRKRKPSAPPDPSLLKHVKINLKGTKSRPNIKQPKFFSPDYPEYDPDRCVSPPKINTEPVFHIDNIKLEPIDIEVPQSPTFFEMSTLMDKSISESSSSQDKTSTASATITKEPKIFSKVKESKGIIIDTIDPIEPAKILPTKLITESGQTVNSKDVLNLNKKAIIVKCQNVKKLIDENTSIQKILDAATTKQTLVEADKSKLPQIRVRNLPTTETMLKKFATTQLTSILKKGETSKHIILKKVGTKPTILRHSLPAKTKEFTTEVQETDESEIAEKISLLAKTKKELGERNDEGMNEGKITTHIIEEGEIITE